MALTTDDFILIVTVLIIAIAAMGLAGTLASSRFTNQKHKDVFKDRKQIGKSNIGTTNKPQTYREIAKNRNLAESKKLQPKMNPKVTRSLTVTTKDVREAGEGEDKGE